MTRRSRPLGLLLFAALAARAAVAADKATPSDPPPASPATAAMRKDLSYLAGQECEGRGLQTQGILKAGDYIAEQFKKIGLQPGTKDGYFQDFSVSGAAKLVGTPRFSWTDEPGEATEAKADQVGATGMSASGSFDAEMVFVGHGITTEDKKYDDYDGIDARGKVVIVVRKAPRFEDKAHPFPEPDRYAPFVEKIRNAEKHQAAGLLFVNDRRSAANDDELLPFQNTNGTEAASFPVFFVRRDLVEEILKPFDKDLVALEESIEKERKPASFVLEKFKAQGEVKVERNRLPARNVIGVLPGKGKLKDEFVVVGGHYDHLGRGERGSLAKGSKDVHPGADDNASGTCGVIELARRFAAKKDYEGRTLVFMTYSGEEQGLLGSAYYCNKAPLFPLDKTVAMVNLDMIGRLTKDDDLGKDKLEVGGLGSAKEFEALVDELNKKHGFAVKKSMAGFGPSDHSSFYGAKVPVWFFFTGIHADYHRPSDTADKVNYEGMKKVIDLAQDVTERMATQPERPTYQPSKDVMSVGPNRGPRLGIMPGDYDEDQTNGVLVGGVNDGGPAAKAGLQKGDWIVSVGGKPVKNMTTYMGAMDGRKRGEPVEVIVRRGKDEVKFKVTPE